MRPATEAAEAPPGLSAHLTAMAGAMALILAVIVVIVVVLARQAAAPQHLGPVLAFFPPGWSPEAVMIASAQAESRLRAAGPLPGLALVEGSQPGMAQRLHAAGAILVLAPLPLDLLAMGGCSGVPRYDPQALKARHAPL